MTDTVIVGVNTDTTVDVSVVVAAVLTSVTTVVKVVSGIDCVWIMVSVCMLSTVSVTMDVCVITETE